MAGKKKVNEGLKASKRSKAIMTAFIVLIVLIIVGFFVYISGIIQKVTTGIKITETSPEGVTTTIENISVVEANYHYYQVLNTFYGYGMITDQEQLDEVFDEETGKTYYMLVMDQAAQEILNSVMVNKAAEENGYLQYSGAERYAELTVDSLRQTATLYGYPTAEQYLQALYGRGMTTFEFRKCVERQTLTQEYENYVRQFLFTASEEDIQAAYDESPETYLRVDFNYYYFAGTANEDGSYDLTDAQNKAEAVIAATTDSESFKAAVMEQIGEEDAELYGFNEEDYDPTFASSYTSANTDMIVDGLTDFTFETGEPGDSTILDAGTGVFVVYLVDRYVNDEATVTYRTLTLYNPANDLENPTDADLLNGRTEMEQRANELAAQATTDTLAFATLVKQNSDNTGEIVSGGYVDGVAASTYEVSDTNPLSDSQIALGEWLFDESRTLGDTFVQVSDDGSKVTIYYFENSVPMWMYTARNQIVTTLVNNWSQEIMVNDPSYAVAYDFMRAISK